MFYHIGDAKKKSEQTRSIEWQSDIVLGKRSRSGAGTGKVAEVSEMDLVREVVFLGEAMQHGSHPPGKALDTPDAFQAALRIASQFLFIFVFVEFHQAASEHAYVGNGEVQPFCAGGRHDVRRIAEQEQSSKLHR